ncbi:MAG: dihydrolipoyl dehydrogenase [Pelagibacteraceae bacterium TMED124]|nr:dihydrolipoyl dehydrogenase [Candidatus Neomarinimicrobiota bacterium]RPG19312.1 MAG: dihydrolipoyl dehydrogenase [Pelagibacteraceae bacterium TMED124]|tara:strand:+ start:3981 stop:5417 length:1437 start_codon:yes stop_codon:yes gene_type:complete
MNNISNSDHELIVIGSGPGGYAAAFRAADLGIKVSLVEKDSNLGGVCLNRGCIPSKSLLYISKIVNETQKASEIGVKFKSPKLEITKINEWKNSIIKNLYTGIESLAKRRNVTIINGKAKFISKNELIISNAEKTMNAKFKNCIIATGSKSSNISNIKINHKNIISSKDALDFKSIPKNMLIIGGGYIGLEMATFYSGMGSNIDVVEFSSNILSDMDYDLVKTLKRELNSKVSILTETKVIDVKDNINNVSVSLESSNKEITKKSYDKILVCVGREPNTGSLNLSNADIETNEKGFIEVNSECRTLTTNIFAIGDITGNPMLAHRATHQGKVAAEVIAGKKRVFEPESIPYVIFTNPEIAWVGPSEKELQNKGEKIGIKTFPWQANAKALTLGCSYGKTKIIYCKKTHKIFSIGIIGTNAGDLIGEAALAIEMNAFVEDISLSIHPHPTLTETIANAAEMIDGTITDLYYPKRKISNH